MHLQAHDLTCVRGGRTVFEGVSLKAAAGEGLALTGPNGAGKSSLLRILAGFLAPAAGEIRFTGAAADIPLGEQCHFVGHLNAVKRALTVAENLQFWAGYLGGARLQQALETFQLQGLADIPAGLLSAGQARRLGLARLLAAPRPVWLLDEPTASLDAAAQKTLSGILGAHLKCGGIVVAATHGTLGVRLAREIRLGHGRKGP